LGVPNDSAASGLGWQDSLPAGLNLDSATFDIIRDPANPFTSTSDADFQNLLIADTATNTVSFSDTLLQLGDVIEITVNYTVAIDADLGSITNTAGIVSMVQTDTNDTNDSSSDSVNVTPAPAPSLSMTKVADDTGPHTVGDIVTYTYTVTNDGNTVINDVAITDTHNGSDPAPVPGNETLLTDAAPTGDSTDAAPNGSWDILAPGDTLTFTGSYTVTQTDAENL